MDNNAQQQQQHRGEMNVSSSPSTPTTTPTTTRTTITNSSYIQILPQSPPLNNNSKMKVVAGYGLQQKLGSGSFAIVYKGVRLTSPSAAVVSDSSNDQQQQTSDQQQQQQQLGSTNGNTDNEFAAIKAIARNSDKLTPKVLHNLEKEIAILRTYRHRNIVGLLDVQKTTNHYYLILDYCAGGDLQHLIRDRKTGRLTEPLCRRLMRDLCQGLLFLNKYSLIHRDIKPQNLLLTGPLPLDELYDPCRTAELESVRQQCNFPSQQFILKIADFGFARHLQTTSLAETLCGSPLYMAPEILSHQRYDEKADLWSVGTVLFEMIAGKPPFNGDNHIHLLQNIQKNAVRLPPGVRVSKECVNLLRILLNRNPTCRATFPDFITACNAFVALGCNGVAINDEGHAANAPSSSNTNTTSTNNNGPSTNDKLNVTGGGTGIVSDSMMTVEEIMMTNTTNQSTTGTVAAPGQYQHVAPAPMTVSASVLTTNAAPTQPSYNNTSDQNNISPQTTMLSSLVPSPPGTGRQISIRNYNMYTNTDSVGNGGGIQLQQQKSNDLIESQQHHGNNSLQNSSDDFVMVEHGSSIHKIASTTTTAIAENKHNTYYTTKTTTSQDNNNNRYRLQQSPPSSPGFLFRKIAGNNNSNNNQTVLPNQPGDYMIPKREHNYRGMLSTSPGTGGALMGMLMGRTAANAVTTAGGGVMGRGGGLFIGNNNNIDQGAVGTTSSKQLEIQIKSATKMLAASEDVGRRAVSVAHLGDHRAVQGIKLFIMMDTTATTSSTMMLSASPMEGIVEEENCGGGVRPHHYRGSSSNNAYIDDSGCTEIMASGGYRRQRSSFSDKHMSDITTKECDEEEETDDMPFALQSESPPLLTAGIPTRTSSTFNKGPAAFITSSSLARHGIVKPTPAMVRSHFSEALLCYVKALNMLKGAVAAVEGVAAEADNILSSKTLSILLSSEQMNHLQHMKHRCDITKKWLGAQFNGVLERGDAANVEIRKFPSIAPISKNNANQYDSNAAGLGQSYESAVVPANTSAAAATGAAVPVIPSVEELIYNQSLALGREGAVKQLLGQNDLARSCYRSAGLLAETLLMDSKNIIGDDRKVLEGYVDAFATQISELDILIMQQQQQPEQGTCYSGQQQHTSRMLVAGSFNSGGLTNIIRQQHQQERQLMGGGGLVTSSTSRTSEFPLALDHPTSSTTSDSSNDKVQKS